MTKVPHENTVRAWARLLKAQQLALAQVERALKAEELPPLAWYDVLLELERAGETGLRPYELEREMLLAQYNLSRLLDRIERAGYVTRRACDDDGRGQVIVITERGKVLRRKMWPIYSHAIEAAVGRHLSAKQSDALSDLLGLVIEGSKTSSALR